MHPNLERSRWAGLVLAAALVTACGATSGEPVAAPGSVDTSDPATGATPAGDTSSLVAPPPDDGGGRGRAVPLAHLPIGGNTTPDGDHPERQCVDVNWIAEHADIPVGVRVTVTGAAFTPEIFETVGSGCGGPRSCTGFVFSTTDQECVLTVEPNGATFDASGDQPVVSLRGKVRCDDAGHRACTSFLADLPGEKNLQIGLDFPQSGPDDSSSPNTSSPTTGSSESSSPDTSSPDARSTQNSSPSGLPSDSASDESSPAP